MWLIDHPMLGGREALERDLAEARRMPADADGRDELIAALEERIAQDDRIQAKLDDPAERARMVTQLTGKAPARWRRRKLRSFLDED